MNYQYQRHQMPNTTQYLQNLNLVFYKTILNLILSTQTYSLLKVNFNPLWIKIHFHLPFNQTNLTSILYFKLTKCYFKTIYQRILNKKIL